MKIIKETNRTIGTLQEYKGVCDACYVDLEYIDELIVIEVEKTEDVIFLCPKDRLVCPNCNHEISLLKLYTNFEISEQLKALKHEHT